MVCSLSNYYAKCGNVPIVTYGRPSNYPLKHPRDTDIPQEMDLDYNTCSVYWIIIIILKNYNFR